MVLADLDHFRDNGDHGYHSGTISGPVSMLIDYVHVYRVSP